MTPSNISEERIKELTNLFERQMKKLDSLVVPWAILEAFWNKKDDVIARAAEMAIGEGNIPFVPVTPLSLLEVDEWMFIGRLKGGLGRFEFDPEKLVDVVKVPDGPYFALNVEDGTNTQGKSSMDAERIIWDLGRSCLTLAEVIALSVCNGVLLFRNMHAAGSRYASNQIPNLYSLHGVPQIGSHTHRPDPDNPSSYSRWGTPSCEGRV